tara:strand:+ start:7025 stop:7783 length:759 start_codon:yes stop_codon:yes gene_type:complete
MNIALCISGYFTNKNNDNLLEYNHIYDYIINNIDKNKHKLDIFIHSFDIKSEHNIRKKYPECKKCIIEPQINFRNKLTPNNIIFEKTLDLNIFPYPITLNSQLSFMYSRKQSINMALEEQMEYNLIIWCRFDMCIRFKKPYNKCNPSKLILPNISEIEVNKLYIADWEHFHSGYSDHWFFSNPEIMKKIGNIYDELYNYYQVDSEFYKHAMSLTKKYNNNGFMANSHTIHEFYLNSHQIILSKIKILRFNGN